MQSLKDHEYDYNEIDNILNQYLDKYGISYTGSAVADEQSQTRKDVLTATPVSSALRPSQLGATRGNDVTTLHDTLQSVKYETKQEGSSTMIQNDGDDLVQLDLVDLEGQSHTAESKKTPNTERNEREVTTHEPSISTLSRDINILEQRVLNNQKSNDHLGNLEHDKSRAETAIQLDDLDNVLTLSENMNESLSQHTRALARLQSNLRNYNRHTSSAAILSNTRNYPGYRHALAHQHYHTKGKRPPSCLRTTRNGPSIPRRMSSSLPDMSLQTPKTLTKSTNSNLIYTPRSESQRRSQSQTQYSNTILDDSLLDYPFDTSNKLIGVSRALDTNDATSTVVINGKLTSIEARTLLGRVHTMELLLDQSAHTIGELRRENARLQRIITSKDASTQKILTLEAEILALRRSLKQSEESRRRQAALIERLKVDSGV
ncbi:Hypothetical protein GLP15_3742 [Giardia lamblia P15]|uniref:Uncharacterized protein n=1 Tax=Giardia intestinalis (strain P15) TaxID=658858 RepID=E1F270_GIAIA|nr:Hypothetical protein GLP15_3742 [Giardia lamblia P15]